MGLNYIWDLLIKAERSGIEKKRVQFALAKVFSPYMELSLENLNAKEVDQIVEINPYYRFYEIFRDLFDPNIESDIELRNSLFDVLIHFLAEIDLMQGMNKREYYIRFLQRDLEAGVFGSSVKDNIHLFTKDEREMIASNLLRLYETGEAVYLLRDTTKKVFTRSTIYANCEEKDELLFYIGQIETPISRAKIELIKDLFLPVRFSTELYWSYHFGIMEVEETMQVDYIALY
ncbi:iron-dependent peroxidase [Brevibacillus laterosporus]|uniref:iron-dependent peroxidase n=1 Tax=Brevibacillus laterosporus TaxID=1465 RepID=UPI0026538803|nr:iron-dependent peroxidase [Brevibacillus laterosporus]MDN9008648.1 iron-dependent peroxidase [Brevibacillus laterosporus]MDO0939734.1 iron-dependent peroxidase [Brevibacillus laterosporus]